jgi:hypothetical protein
MNSSDHLCGQITPLFTRREILRNMSCGFGWVAFAALAGKSPAAVAASPSPGRGGPLLPKASHFSPRAKRVIFLTMRGGPSHVDTFDEKPVLNADAGKRSTTTGWMGIATLRIPTSARN